VPIPFVTQLLIGIALNVAGYLLMPKPKTAKPEAAKEQERQTAESGKPITVVFGSLTIESSNLVGEFDKEMLTREVSAGGKK